MAEKPVYDVAVIGGGLVGSISALALANAGLTVAFIAPEMPEDARTSALMLPVCDFLASQDVFGDPREMATPLTRIRIIDATKRFVRAPETLFDAESENLSAFSYNFPNATLAKSLNAQIENRQNIVRINKFARQFSQTEGGNWSVGLVDETQISARLVVGADGKKSAVRAALGSDVSTQAFAQLALVCDVKLTRALGSESVEFHYENGPFTLVPAGGQNANLVWVDREETLQAALESNEEGFADILRTKSENLFGPCTVMTQKHVFPLSTLRVGRIGGTGLVLVGEAAHAFPPIGAQGLNLGIRDVEALAQLAVDSDRAQSDWATKLSENYADQRDRDISRTTNFVDLLFKSLLAEYLPSQMLRSSAIFALNAVSPARKFAFKTGMGA